MSEVQVENSPSPNVGDDKGAGASSAPCFDIDWWTMLTDPEFLKNPYPELKRIRELAPVQFDPQSGIYFVLGHKEFGLMAKTSSMGRDTTYWRNGWSSPENRQNDPETYELFVDFQPQMINANQPDHRRMRGVFDKAFRPRDMMRYLPMIKDECRKLLDRLPESEAFEYMDLFGNPLPNRISLKLFDIPEKMEAQIGKWISDLSWLGNIVMTPEQKRNVKKSNQEFKQFVKEHLEGLRKNPGDGFVGMALAAAEDGTMDEEETLNNVVMLIAGSKTSLTLLGNGLLTLLKHPAQMEKLRADRSLMPRAIEEMLRYESGSSIIPRAGVEDFQCGDVCIPAGALAIGLVGAINRDPARFDDPDTFNITRKPNHHSAFGGGPHICIGKALARMTTEVAFNALMDRYSRIELAGDATWWTDRSDQRGLSSLPLKLTPA